MGLQNIIVQKLMDLNLKLGIIETSTNGMICSNFAINTNYEKVFKVGFVLNDPSLFYKFNIDENNKFIEQINARKLAKYLKNEFDCDLVLSVLSTSNDLDLKEIKDLNINIENKNNPNGHAFISILVVDKYTDFELQFKSSDELRDRLLITNKALNELLSVVLKLK